MISDLFIRQIAITETSPCAKESDVVFGSDRVGATREIVGIVGARVRRKHAPVRRTIEANKIAKYLNLKTKSNLKIFELIKIKYKKNKFLTVTIRLIVEILLMAVTLTL